MSVCLAALFSGAIAYSILAPSASVGASQELVYDISVTVQNGGGVDNSNDHWARGEQCFAGRGSARTSTHVTIQKVTGANVLLKYSFEGETGGTACPSGTLFYTSLNGWNVMAKSTKRFYDREALVAKLLKHYIDPASSLRVGEAAKVSSWSWKTVENPAGIRNGNGYFMAGIDVCGTDPGVIKVLGVSGNNVLVRYRTRNTKFGTPCPDGTIFFTNYQAFGKKAPHRRPDTSSKLV